MVCLIVALAISDVWQKEGVEIEDVPIDVEVEAAKLQFVKVDSKIRRMFG
jgi:hypothetical protein